MATEIELALKAIQDRKDKNKTKTKVDNSSLRAGSPMYYYCRMCGEEMVLPEEHREPAPRFCLDCLKAQTLVDISPYPVSRC